MRVPIMGRWMTPDPLAGDITNPQSLNRYAYALNSPTTFTDPTGLDAEACWTWRGDPGDLPGCFNWGHRGGSGVGGDTGVYCSTINPYDAQCGFTSALLNPLGIGGPSGVDFSGLFGGGGGPLSGDYGPFAMPDPVYAPGCEFGNCSGGAPNSFVSGLNAGPWLIGVNTDIYKIGITVWGWGGLAVIPGPGAPGANGLAQALKQSTRGFPKVPPTRMPLPVPDPRQIPSDALEVDTWLARYMRALGAALGGILDTAGKEYFFIMMSDPCSTVPQSFPGRCGGKKF